MFIQVSDIHSLYYEVYGNPEGMPYLFVHGGPGLGYSEKDKRFFDPEIHFVIFYDQRGCGKSLPIGELSENTTDLLIEDINKLLDHLGISIVNIFAGSWGATLSILYAASNQNRVKSLILRGFFSATMSTIDLYLRGGIKSSHPQSWSRVSSHVSEDYKTKVPEYYFQKMIDDKDSYEFAYEWSRYGLSLSRKEIDKSTIDSIMEDYVDSSQKIKIELHFALNKFFIPDGYVFEQASKIQSIPTTILHGRHDHICPIADAERLHRTINGSKLVILDAGHSTSEMEEKLRVLMKSTV